MSINRKILLLMALTILISRLWELFYFEGVFVDMWASIGLDITKKYDLFLFYDVEQYLHWYAQYTNYLLTQVILTYIIYILLRSSAAKALVIGSKILVIFSIFRLISYWLFRGSIEFEIICTAIAGFLILLTSTWRRSYS